MKSIEYTTRAIRLVCTDLDGTLLGNPPALARFARLWAAVAGPSRPKLVYNTSRPVSEVLSLLRRSALPEADHVIGSLGTEFYDSRARSLRQERLAELDRDWCADAAHRCALELPGLKSQGPERQSPWRRSYWWSRPPEGGLGRLRSLLATAGLDAKVIHSNKLELDIVPGSAGKGSGLLWLLRNLGISSGQTLVAGDSGRDREMLELPGVRAAVLPHEHGDLDHLRAGPELVRCAQRAADGVLEALVHFGVLPAHIAERESIAAHMGSDAERQMAQLGRTFHVIESPAHA